MKNPIVSKIFLFSTLALACFLFVEKCKYGNLESQLNSTIKTDTVFVNKPYKIEVPKIVERPTKVLVYKTDTVLRQEIEKNELVLKVHYKRNFLFKDLSFLKVDKIDREGVITSNSYPVKDVKEIKIFADGKTETKKRRFIVPKIIGVTVLTGATAYVGWGIYKNIK